MKRAFTTKSLQILRICFFAVQFSWSMRYAVIVGQNDGGSGVDKLQFAEEDAREFSVLLTGLAGFKADDVRLLLHPDSAQLSSALAGFSRYFHNKDASNNDLFLFYYSGHSDDTNLKLGSQKFPLEQIRLFLNDMSSSIKIGIFDACQSGAVTQFKGGSRAEPFFMQSQKKIRGQVIIASSAAEELAQESSMLRGSVFSHHWFNGLRGSADNSGDRQVTLTEAYRYAYRKTIETTALTGGGVQHPSYKFNIYGEGDIMLTDLSSESSGAVFEENMEGKCLILSRDYSGILADFNKQLQQESFIALHPGEYTAIFIEGTESRIQDFTIVPGRDHNIYRDSMMINPATLNRVKGTNQAAKKAIEVKAMPLSRYTWGPGAGTFFALSKDLRDQANVFKLSLANLLYMRNDINLFFNLSWVAFGMNFGGDFGLDYLSGTGGQTAYIGLGAGYYNYARDKMVVTETLGPALTAHAGAIFDVGRTIQLKVEIPYHVVFNKSIDQTIGLDIGILFSGPYRHVKALYY